MYRGYTDICRRISSEGDRWYATSAWGPTTPRSYTFPHFSSNSLFFFLFSKSKRDWAYMVTVGRNNGQSFRVMMTGRFYLFYCIKTV